MRRRWGRVMGEVEGGWLVQGCGGGGDRQLVRSKLEGGGQRAVWVWGLGVGCEWWRLWGDNWGNGGHGVVER